jgi:hypothetical protein
MWVLHIVDDDTGTDAVRHAGRACSPRTHRPFRPVHQDGQPNTLNERIQTSSWGRAPDRQRPAHLLCCLSRRACRRRPTGTLRPAPWRPAAACRRSAGTAVQTPPPGEGARRRAGQRVAGQRVTPATRQSRTTSARWMQSSAPTGICQAGAARPPCSAGLAARSRWPAVGERHPSAALACSLLRESQRPSHARIWAAGCEGGDQAWWVWGWVWGWMWGGVWGGCVGVQMQRRGDSLAAGQYVARNEAPCRWSTFGE